MIKVFELLEINAGLYISPTEIAEVIEIKTEEVFGAEHMGHTLITLKNGNSHISPISPLKLFKNWAASGSESGFRGVDIYTIYKEDDEDNNLKVETTSE